MRAWMAFTLAGSLALSACGMQAEGKAREIAAAGLKDPSSAQFRGLKAYASLHDQAAGRNSPANRVCGEINGKNSFGAFTGFQRFVVDLDAGTVMFAPEAPEEFRTPEDQAAGYAGIIFDAEYGAGCRTASPPL